MRTAPRPNGRGACASGQGTHHPRRAGTEALPFPTGPLLREGAAPSGTEAPSDPGQSAGAGHTSQAAASSGRTARDQESAADESHPADGCSVAARRSCSRRARSRSRPTDRSWVRMGDTIVLVTVVSAQGEEGGHRLLPAHRRLPGEAVRGGQDPGQLLPARGPAHREGDARLPLDRPLLPPAVPRRLRERDADHRHRHLLRPGERHRRARASPAPRRRSSSRTSPSTAPSPASASAASDGQFVANPTLAQRAECRPRHGHGRLRGRHRDGRGRRRRRCPRRSWSTRSSSARPR